MEIKSLKEIRFEIIYNAFSQAFEDYEIKLNQEQLQKMLKRRGFSPELSFALFEDGEIASFTLNGIGYFNGIKTAYDTGTGTIKEFRGKKLVNEIFNYSIPFLKKNDISQYLLEVLQHNSKAISVYEKLGFQISREFNYFVKKIDEINTESTIKVNNCNIKQIEFHNITSVEEFWEFYPSWQNSIDAINRELSDFNIFGAFSNENIIGYCITEPISGDITQLAVKKENRRKGVASLLLQKAINASINDTIKIINTDINCCSINEFLKAKNIEIAGKQYEMIKDL